MSGGQPPKPPATPAQPGLAWRASSSMVMGLVGGLARAALYGANRVEVHGLESFRALLDSRAEPGKRRRGLITVSNHTSVVDDPLIWGTLPFRYGFRPDNHRWTLGSYDICFQGRLLSTLFNLGQLLPTHRQKHSPYGGLFQPTMTEAIRLLGECPVPEPPAPPRRKAGSSLLQPSPPSSADSASSSSPLISSTPLSSSSSRYHLSSSDIPDPFSSAALTYTTDGVDSFPRPSAFASRRHAWIHIFPEGFVHQHPARAMRYFKWGVARLILEADECPDVVPIWHEGSERIMPEDRGFPRAVPRLLQRVGIWFGDNVAGARSAAEGNVFAELRARWDTLVKTERRRTGDDLVGTSPDALTDELRFGEAAVRLRVETALAVRRAVLDVRRRRGLPDEDPKASLADTYREEGSGGGGGSSGSGGNGNEEGKQKDGSWVKDV